LLSVCAITVGELQRGVENLRTHDPSRAAALHDWVTQIAGQYACLPIDVETCRIWATLVTRTPESLFVDALIAACAIRHNLIVVTRNTKDFARFRVRILNPFDPQPKVESYLELFSPTENVKLSDYHS
jgi:predicted nucleic acid-binding protein